MISGFDQRLFDVIESHPSIIVGTCDRACVPAIARSFGARVLENRPCLELLVSRWPGPETLSNLRESGRVAVTFTAPETFEAYQVKGRMTDWGECTPEDLALSETYCQTIRRRIEALREPPALTRVTFSPRGLFRITIEVDSVFVQTPGKNAGQKL
jgi:hypothetical protein